MKDMEKEIAKIGEDARRVNSGQNDVIICQSDEIEKL